MRGLVSPFARALVLFSIATTAASCSDAPIAEDSLSADGVLRCADKAAYGQVEAVESRGASSSIDFAVRRWVVSGARGSSLSFTVDAADDNWSVGDEGLLVLGVGPPLLLDSAQADEVEASWDGTNHPASKNCDA